MEALTYRVLLWISLLIWPLNTTDSDEAVHEFSGADNFVYRNAKRPDLSDETCLRVHHTSRDICKRFYAILPYFDKEHSNTAFLHKFRATVHGMSEGEDLLDKEAAFYAAVLTPLVFLQNYRDTWCLLERFHRALRLYQISHPTEKRSSLKLLQNFRAVNQQVSILSIDTKQQKSYSLSVDSGEPSMSTVDPNLIGMNIPDFTVELPNLQKFVWELPGSTTAVRSRTNSPPELDEEEVHDKRENRYFNELFKNLG